MKITSNIISVVILFIAIIFGFAFVTFGGVTDRTPTNNVEELSTWTFFTATTSSTALSDGGGFMPIAGAEKIVFYFGRGGATGPNLGKSVFTIEVTPDGSNWYTFGKLVGSDVSATATSSVSIVAATSTVQFAMNLQHDAYEGVRCRVVETTDGEHTCLGQAQYGK